MIMILLLLLWMRLLLLFIRVFIIVIIVASIITTTIISIVIVRTLSTYCLRYLQSDVLLSLLSLFDTRWAHSNWNHFGYFYTCGVPF